MKKTIQLLIQIAFLTLFIFLLIIGKVQLWMGLLLSGIAASFLLGRVYCGWLCSINTAMQVITRIKKKLHIKSLSIPEFLTRPWIRLLALGLFIAAFVFTMTTGRKLPVLPVLFLTGIITAFLFPEELWHHYLCPYGTIMSLPASKARHSMKIDVDKCSSCGACIRICPAKAIEKNKKYHEIIKKDCLVCMECSRSCRQDAISYK